MSNGVGACYDDQTGGSSGGGTINIFYKDSYNNSGIIKAEKGLRTNGRLTSGGAGGTGSISVGQILNGTYVSTYTNY